MKRRQPGVASGWGGPRGWRQALLMAPMLACATGVPHRTVPFTSMERGSAAAATSRQGREAPSSQRGSIVSDSIWSQALGIRKQFLVWLPPSYGAEPERRYPVAFYLHGAWGSETDWVRQGRLDVSLDSLAEAGMPEMIVVMPDGDDGWYTTWNWLGDYAACRRGRVAGAEPPETYCVPWPHYDDYIARDLVAHVDRTWRTLAERRHRGIAGLSMGGYGAVALALGYPDVFSAAASHSGLVSPLSQGRGADDDKPVSLDAVRQSYPAALWRMLEPAFGKDTAGWLARDPAQLAERLLRRAPGLVPALFLDCGVDDFLIEQNRAFHRSLDRLGIPHRYAEWPGAHRWDYWRHHGVESAQWLARTLSVR